jgi:hypothetical protein
MHSELLVQRKNWKIERGERKFPIPPTPPISPLMLLAIVLQMFLENLLDWIALTRTLQLNSIIAQQKQNSRAKSIAFT